MDRNHIARRERGKNQDDERRFGFNEDSPPETQFFYDYFDVGYGGVAAADRHRPGYIYQYYDRDGDGYYDCLATIDDGDQQNDSPRRALVYFGPPRETQSADTTVALSIYGR